MSSSRPEGPRLWFGGQRVSGPVLDRLVRMGHGFHPFGAPTEQELETLRSALAQGGRSVDEIEMIGGTRATFGSDDACADLRAAMAPIAEQWEQGYTTFAIKPSQYIDDPADMDTFVRDVVRRADGLV
ncbi:hypothetical protein K0651_13015 [Ornithinimicrobium sp. Arc0846-15]|nr:hypothetical protein [Ornithinimicrobium laminariae]